MNETVCPGCGVALKPDDASVDGDYNASGACRRLFDELSAFTLTAGDPDFIHQVVADVYAAQHSSPRAKPIGTAFALIGLCLAFERGQTGRGVQRAHMVLGKRHRDWPRFDPPEGHALLTAGDVVPGLDAENYRERIQAWGRAVWEWWAPERGRISRLVQGYLDG
jgi:hypothetical protein